MKIWVRQTGWAPCRDQYKNLCYSREFICNRWS